MSQVKLIAEPWDVGEGGYQVGNFPPLWSEWNGKYRDTVRDFWRGEPATLGEFASRLTGSSDLYQDDGRHPARASTSSPRTTASRSPTSSPTTTSTTRRTARTTATATNDNRSWNCGVEGPTDDRAGARAAHRQQRNFLATLFLSQGVPMLLGGDEIGRTQHGNNNAYCQDNEISWFDWENQDEALLAFTRRMIALRRDHPVLRRRRWFQGEPIRVGRSTSAGAWPDGAEMSDDDWGRHRLGRAVPGTARRSRP